MRDSRNERGAVAIVVAISAVIIFVVAALVVDLGLARDSKRLSQNAADSAALAAGNVLYNTVGQPQFALAVTEAKSYAEQNLNIPTSAWTGCTDKSPLAYVPPSSTPCISFDNGTRPTRVRVNLPVKQIDTGLGVLAGVKTIRIDASARAALTPGVHIECSLCVLGSTVHHIGNGDISMIQVTGGGGIHINGSLDGQPQSNVDAGSGSITIEGTFGASDFDPPPVHGPRIGDPFASVVFPTSYSAYTSTSNTCKTSPGVYKSMELGPNETCTMGAGLYVFTGTVSLKNTSKLLGTGVTLLFTCSNATQAIPCGSSGAAGGTFDATNGEVKISKGSTQYPTMIVMYDRHNTSPMTLQGNGGSVLSGNVYAPSSLVYANGNSCHTVDGGSVIVNDIYMNGTQSCLNVNNGTPAVYDLPPSGLHLDQ